MQLPGNATLIKLKSAPYLATQVVLARTSGALAFVTWMRDTDTGACYWGHYFADLDSALSDFNQRGD